MVRERTAGTGPLRRVARSSRAHVTRWSLHSFGACA
jgi:hypothetical protein